MSFIKKFYLIFLELPEKTKRLLFLVFCFLGVLLWILFSHPFKNRVYSASSVGMLGSYFVSSDFCFDDDMQNASSSSDCGQKSDVFIKESTDFEFFLKNYVSSISSKKPILIIWTAPKVVSNVNYILYNATHSEAILWINALLQRSGDIGFYEYPPSTYLKFRVLLYYDKKIPNSLELSKKYIHESILRNYAFSEAVKKER